MCESQFCSSVVSAIVVQGNCVTRQVSMVQGKYVTRKVTVTFKQSHLQGIDWSRDEERIS